MFARAREFFPGSHSGLASDSPKPILFVGSAETLLRREAGIPEPNWDFLLGPWDADELIFRAFKLFTSQADRSREATAGKVRGSRRGSRRWSDKN